MAEKSKRPKKESGDKNGGQVFHIEGGIHAERDVIQGDQTNIYHQQIANIQTPAAFVAELQKLQEQIAALKKKPELTSSQTQTLEVVEGQIKEVAEEAKKPEPLGARITATLTGAKAVMDSISGSVESAVGLGAALAGLTKIAMTLF